MKCRAPPCGPLARTGFSTTLKPVLRSRAVNFESGPDDHTASTPPGRSAAWTARNPLRSYSRSLAWRVIPSGPLSTSSRIASYSDRAARIRSPTSVSLMRTRGSVRLSPNSSAIGPRAQVTTAGTSSATMMWACFPSTVRAARKVKPIPNPPIRILGRLTGRLRVRIFSQAMVASACSVALRRLFINSSRPSRIENSAPRCIRRSSPPPGTCAVSRRDQGITGSSPAVSAGGRLSGERRIIGIALRARRIERGHVGRIHRGMQFPACNQVRVGQERLAERDQIAFAGGEIALGAGGVVAPGQNERAFEHAAERGLHRVEHLWRPHRRVVDQMDVEQASRVALLRQISVVRFHLRIERHVVEYAERRQPDADLVLADGGDRRIDDLQRKAHAVLD